MKPYILSIILLAVLLFFVIRGFRKGIIVMLLGIASWLFLIVFSSWLGPVIRTQLESSSAVSSRVNAAVEKKITEQENKNGISVSFDGGTGIVLPSFMEDSFERTEAKIASTVTDARYRVHRALVETCSDFVMRGISLVITGIITLLIVFFLRRIILLVSKLPVIHGASRALGGILGLVEGMLAVWLILYLFECFGAAKGGGAAYIAADPVLSFIERYNIFHRI